LLLAAVTLGAYWPVVGHDFINYDDPLYVTDNPHVQAGLTTEGMAWAFGRVTGEGTYWHPLTWLSHMLDCQLFGLKAGRHHLTNLLFHTANVLLLFLALRRMTGAVWRSGLVAALFALHPLQVDTVAWVAERKNVLSTCFWMLTLLAYSAYARRPAATRYVLVCTAFALGLMCKPMLVTIPCVLLLLDYWPIRRFAGKQAGPLNPEALSCPRYHWHRLLLEKVPLFALAAISCAITLTAHERLHLMPTEHQVSLVSRFENALVAYTAYLQKIVWPVDLAVFYPYHWEWPLDRVMFSALLLAAISLLVGWSARRRPYVMTGWLWYLGTLVPVIGLVQAGFQSMADRFVYVPMIGVLLLTAWGLPAMLQRVPFHSYIMAAIAGVVLCACFFATRRQLSYWQDSETLFGHAVKVTRNNFVAMLNYGVALGEHGKLEEAVQQYRQALVAYPGYPLAECNLANTLSLQGKYEEAIPHYAAALNRHPDYAEAEFNWGNALALQGKLAEAEPHFRAALRLKPHYAEAHNSYGNLLMLQGRTDEAIEHYRAAVTAKPDYAEALCFLGRALARQKKYGEAVAEFRATIKFKPDHHAALNDLAWILATQKDPQIRNVPEAVQLAEQACRLTGNGEALYLDTLAVAYSEAGQFPAAVQASEQALHLAEAAKDEALAEQLRPHLKAFREGRSYRQAFDR
jgi:protein O-mannosyl-transferase